MLCLFIFYNYSNTPQSRQTGDSSRYASPMIFNSIFIHWIVYYFWFVQIDLPNQFFLFVFSSNSVSTPNLNVTSSTMGTTPNNTFGSNSNIAGSISSTAIAKPSNTQGALNDVQVLALFNESHRKHVQIDKFSTELKTLQNLSPFLITRRRKLFPESFQSSIPIIPQLKRHANSNCYSSNSKPASKTRISELILNKIENFQKFQSPQIIQANNTAATNSTQQRSTDVENLISTPQPSYENHKFLSHGYDGPNYGTYLIQFVFSFGFYVWRWKINFTIVLIYSKR